MENLINKKLIFNQEPFSISLNPEELNNFPRETLISFIAQDHYEIKSRVSDETFRSFINYFNHQILPDIQNDKIDEYAQLNEEFQIPAISQLIQAKKEYYQNRHNIIQKLKENTLTDRSNYEVKISHNLDDYIKDYGEELFSIPIQSLYNIFSNEERNFTLHDELYNLILSYHQRTNDSNIFVLFQLIDSNSISHQNLVNLIDSKDEHYGFIPKIDSSILSGKNSTKNDGSFNICQNGLNFKLNHNKFTAKVTVVAPSSQIFIPKSIKFNSIDYFVTKIGNCCLTYHRGTRSIKFSDDIDIDCIDLSSFRSETIDYISIPSKVEKFIIDQYFKAQTVFVSSQNKNFYWDGKLLFGKSDPEIEHFNTLVYACRDIEEIQIESNIEIIGPYCFYQCKHLKKVEFSPDSRLRLIENDAFSESSIENFSIPSSVEIIERNAFNSCKKLQTINFSDDSKIQSIGYTSFANLPIKCFSIPKNLMLIGEYAFIRCYELTNVVFEENSRLQQIDRGAFSLTKIQRINLPSSLLILKGGFEYSSIEFIIDENQQNFKFEKGVLYGKTEPNIDFFDTIIYAQPTIDRITIPANIKYIEPFCFQQCKNLTVVEFSPDSKLAFIGEGVFKNSSIESIKIPKNVTSIGSQAFSECKNLKQVTFDPNCELEIIDCHAFYNVAIDSIVIPQKVKIIYNSAFCFCENLKNVKFTDNSEIEMILFGAFQYDPLLKEIMIPQKVQIFDSFDKECIVKRK